MALTTLSNAMRQFYDDNDPTSSELLDFVDNYITAENAKYKTAVANNLVTFGKFKGFSVEQVVASPKGTDYLMWLMSQQWFTEDKFPGLIAEIKKHTLKKTNK